MRPLRSETDVSSLPTVTFGERSLMWWGTAGFMVIEGWTSAILLAAYLYLRENYEAWPPPRTPYPSLLIPTINVVVMLVSLIPSGLAARAAKRLDEAALKRWLIVMCVTTVPTVVLRWWDLWSLNTRWDTNAYGSAAWTIAGFHTSLLIVDVLDTIGLTLFYHLKPMPAKALSDAADNSFYWIFTVAIWIPAYLIVYVGPRLF